MKFFMRMMLSVFFATLNCSCNAADDPFSGCFKLVDSGMGPRPVKVECVPAVAIAKAGDSTVLISACTTGGDATQCEWEKQCMAADHPAWADKDKRAVANACAEDFKEFGHDLLQYPTSSFHYDEKSWKNTSPMADHQEGYAERTLRAECKVRSAASLARGMYGCVEYSIEAREWARQGNKTQFDAVKKLWGDIKQSHFVDEITHANP